MKSDLTCNNPTKRFIKYFEGAKSAYAQIHSCDKVTQKAVVSWYNQEFRASLTEASLSKYLKGINEIPLQVYLNMGKLAGVEEFVLGPSASREEYEISSSIKESLEFIWGEVEYLCRNEDLKIACGDCVQQILNAFVKYCEYAMDNDYVNGMQKLYEMQEAVHIAENQMSMARDKHLNACIDIKKSFTASQTTGEADTKQPLYLYEELLNRFCMIAMEVKNCSCLQRKINKDHYGEIPKYEEAMLYEKAKGMMEE